MVSRRPWDGYQAVCCFDRRAVGHLVVWGPEGFYLINRISTPCGYIFSLFLPYLAMTEHCFPRVSVSSAPLATSRSVYLGNCGLAALFFASFYQACSLFLPFRLLFPVSSIFFGFFGVCLQLRGKDDVWRFW